MRMKIAEFRKGSDEHDSNKDCTITWADLEWWEVRMNDRYRRYSTLSQVQINDTNHESRDHLTVDDNQQ